MAFSIHSVYGQIFKMWRRKRYQTFLAEIRPQAHEWMLDIGGYPGNWTEPPQTLRQIDCLNVHLVEWEPGNHPSHRIEALVGDGCALEYPDHSYDIAYSNSVIEHVGDWDRQVAFAAEIRRVGRRLWVQTPAYECPIEPHFLAPFVHWFPVPIRRVLVRWLTPWGWIQRPSREEVARTIDSTQLLTKGQMRALFPDCRILTERLAWVLPKSYIAVRDDTGPGTAKNV